VESLERRVLLSDSSIARNAVMVASGQVAPVSSALAPAAIRNFYGVNSIEGNGAGQTIAIIEWDNDPDIASDLDTFDEQYGAGSSGPTLYAQYGPAASFLNVYAQEGTSDSFLPQDEDSELPEDAALSGGDSEISLDVEWAHALAPAAAIDVVEAADPSYVTDAINFGKTLPSVSVVSMSFSFSDGAFSASTLSQPGVTFVASTGDYGSYEPPFDFGPESSNGLIGTGFGGSSDSFEAIPLTSYAGNFLVTTQLLSGTDAIQAGISVRDAYQTGTSANVSLLALPGSDSTGTSGILQYRATDGGSTTVITSGFAAPIGTYMAMERMGTQYFAYTSSTGVDWSLVGSISVPALNGIVFADLVGASGSMSTPATCNFGDTEFYYDTVATFAPATSPNVLAVGGTTLLTDGEGNIISGQPNTETAWGNGTLSFLPYSFGGTGSNGGFSTMETTPAYQLAFNSNSYRSVPDVAFDGGTPVSIYDSDNTSPGWEAVLGTSIGAPAWSGLVSVIDQNRIANGFPVFDSNGTSIDGNSIQSALYQLAGDSAAYSNGFNDITSGSNGAYSASTGYDLVTGLGTPKMASLINDLTAVTWTGDGGDIYWSDPSNWSDGAVPDQFDNVIITSGVDVKVTAGTFDANNVEIGSSSSLFINGTLSIAGALTVGGDATVMIGNGDSTGTLSASAIVNGGTLVFNRSDSGIVISAIISGSGVVVQEGSGDTLLSGDNSYTGATTVSSGTLQLGSSQAIGSSGIDVDGGKFDLNGFSVVTGPLSGTGGSIINSSSIVATLTIIATSTETYSGAIKGDGSLAVAIEAGTEVFSGANTYAAGTTIDGGASIVAGSTAALGSAASNLYIDGGALDLAGFSLTIGGLAGESGTITNSSSVGATLTIAGTSSGTFSGAIKGNGATAIAIESSILLNGDNTFDGGTTIYGGATLTAGSTSALGSAQSPLYIDGGKLDLGGFNLTTGELSGPSGTITNTGSSGATLTISGTTTGTFAGTIKGDGNMAVAIAGSGAVFTGANTYDGGTIVDSGTLVIGSVASLPTNTALTIGVGSGAGTVQLATTAAGLVVNGASNYGGSGYTLSSLLISSNSMLDVGTNAVALDYAGGADPVSTIASYLESGFNASAAEIGGWNGPGINSSAVAYANSIQSSLVYGVGYADGASGLLSQIPSGEILVMPTLDGDSKLLGKVSFGDFQLLSQYFGTTGGAWDEGNYMYAASVDFGDFQLLAMNYGSNSAGLLDPQDPDPSTVVLTIVASDGSYTVYADDTSGDNAGIADFDIDVQGDGGVEVTSSYEIAPYGSRVVDGNYFFRGFGIWTSNGDDQNENGGGDGMEITAMQNITGEMGSANVIQGFGQTSGSFGSMTWVQTSLGVAIATGTYSGSSGTLTVDVAPNAYIQVLTSGSNGEWLGAGNVSNAEVTGDTINILS